MAGFNTPQNPRLQIGNGRPSGIAPAEQMPQQPAQPAQRALPAGASDVAQRRFQEAMARRMQAQNRQQVPGNRVVSPQRPQIPQAPARAMSGQPVSAGGVAGGPPMQPQIPAGIAVGEPYPQQQAINNYPPMNAPQNALGRGPSFDGIGLLQRIGPSVGPGIVPSRG